MILASPTQNFQERESGGRGQGKGERRGREGKIRERREEGLDWGERGDDRIGQDRRAPEVGRGSAICFDPQRQKQMSWAARSDKLESDCTEDWNLSQAVNPSFSTRRPRPQRPAGVRPACAWRQMLLKGPPSPAGSCQLL